ncbi:hypothetical protein EYF80_060228 [Liparis tanakae]|uniref:Uncharacterized protein n=1 Tax=Liparis tanakae TaxID=230148 RepID=A0A4Z2EL99_9TELE|nr:hypothetical protein EYF80_060228 [Liparis tanakae]
MKEASEGAEETRGASRGSVQLLGKGSRGTAPSPLRKPLGPRLLISSPWTSSVKQQQQQHLHQKQRISLECTAAELLLV